MLFRQILYLFLTVFAVFVILNFFPSSQNYWVVIAAFLLTQLRSDLTPLKRFGVLFLAGLVLSSTTLFASLLSEHLVAYSFFLFLLGGTGIYIGLQVSQLNYFVFILILFSILSGLDSVMLPEIIQRSFFILLGALVAIFAYLPLIYKDKKYQIRAKLISSIRYLKYFSEDVFASLKGSSTKNNYLTERRIHAKKMKFFQSISAIKVNLENLHENAVNLNLKNIKAKLNVIFLLLVSCGQIRFREEDLTIFDVCKRELNQIEENIENKFISIIDYLYGRDSIKKIDLLEKIESLEDVYFHVLQITAKDPINFLLFISDLKTLNNETDRLIAAVERLRKTSFV